MLPSDTATTEIEADPGRLKARLRPMRGLKRLATSAVIAAGHAFVQNIRRGHYELAVDNSAAVRLVAASTDLARTILNRRSRGRTAPGAGERRHTDGALDTREHPGRPATFATFRMGNDCDVWQVGSTPTAPDCSDAPTRTRRTPRSAHLNRGDA